MLSKVAAPFYIPTSNISICLPILIIFFFLIVDILADVKWYLIMVFIYMFLMTNDVELFSVLIGHYNSYLEKNLFNPLPIFKLGCLVYYWVVSFIYSGNKYLFQYVICNTFSHSIGFSSLSWWWSLKHKNLILVTSNLSVLSFIKLVLLVLYIRNNCLTQGHEDLLQCFVPHFIVLALIFRSLTHF